MMIVVQALWRGYQLRKRLIQALSYAQNEESDDDMGEVDLSNFEMKDEEWFAPEVPQLPQR